MLLENERKGKQNEGVKDLLNEEHKAELGKILAFGEKYKKVGDIMEREFWRKGCKEYFNNLIGGYQESKKKFEERLSLEERQILESLSDVAKEKFYEEYLYKRIFYGGDPKKVCLGEEINPLSLRSHKDKLQPLMKIDFKWYNIGDTGVKILAKEWKGKLKPGMEINLNSNKIGVEGAKILAEEWKDSLQPGIEINLYNNKIGDELAKVLAKEWKGKLKPGMVIGLGGNEIGVEGVRALAKEWKDCLQPGIDIDLMGNKIGDEGIEILAKERKNSLKPGMKIRLWGNGISNKGAQAIIDNMELTEGVEIFLQDNKITTRKFQELTKWMNSFRK